MNIQVQYREEESDEGVPVAEVPFRREAIDAIIPLIQSWGLANAGADSSITTDLLYGQFRVLADRVIFEVINPA